MRLKKDRSLGKGKRKGKLKIERRMTEETRWWEKITGEDNL